MIQLKEIIGLPSLQYHLDNGLTLSENIYRYSSDAFINLFKEAREAVRNGDIKLNEEDIELLVPILNQLEKDYQKELSGLV